MRPEDMEWGVVAMDDRVKKLVPFEFLKGRLPGQVGGRIEVPIVAVSGNSVSAQG